MSVCHRYGSCDATGIEADVEGETIKIIRKDLKTIIEEAVAQVVGLIKGGSHVVSVKK